MNWRNSIQLMKFNPAAIQNGGNGLKPASKHSFFNLRNSYWFQIENGMRLLARLTELIPCRSFWICLIDLISEYSEINQFQQTKSRIENAAWESIINSLFATCSLHSHFFLSSSFHYRGFNLQLAAPTTAFIPGFQFISA